MVLPPSYKSDASPETAPATETKSTGVASEIGDDRTSGCFIVLRTVTAAANYIYKMTTRETGTDGQKDGALFPPVERE